MPSAWEEFYRSCFSTFKMKRIDLSKNRWHWIKGNNLNVQTIYRAAKAKSTNENINVLTISLGWWGRWKKKERKFTRSHTQKPFFEIQFIIFCLKFVSLLVFASSFLCVYKYSRVCGFFSLFLRFVFLSHFALTLFILWRLLSLIRFPFCSLCIFSRHFHKSGGVKPKH